MQFLKQSTAVDVRIGCFMDISDAVTPVTNVVLASADQAELLKHNGAGTTDISGNAWSAVTNCDGWYDLTLTTDDTATLGLLEVVIQDADLCLPTFARFMVVPTNVYDSFFSTDNLQVDVTQVGGGAVAGASDLKADVSALAIEGNVEGHVTTSLNSYDPPTRTEATSDKEAITTAIGNLNDLSSSDIATELETYDGVKRSEATSDKEAITTAIGNLNDLSSSDIATELETYDGVKRSEATSDKDEIITEVDANETKIDALNDLSSSDIDTALETYDAVKRSEATSDKDEIITEVDANETKIDTLDAKVVVVDGIVDTINSNLTTVDGNVDSIKTQTDKIPYILGLSQENYRISSPVYSSGLLTSATVKIYSSKTDCDNAENEIATYTLTATYDGSNQMETYKVVKE